MASLFGQLDWSGRLVHPAYFIQVTQGLVSRVWLDIDYKNRDLVPDEAVRRMLAAIHSTIFQGAVQTSIEGYAVALSQLRRIMAANRGSRELFSQAGFSLDEITQVLQMLEATRE